MSYLNRLPDDVMREINLQSRVGEYQPWLRGFDPYSYYPFERERDPDTYWSRGMKLTFEPLTDFHDRNAKADKLAKYTLGAGVLGFGALSARSIWTSSAWGIFETPKYPPPSREILYKDLYKEDPSATPMSHKSGEPLWLIHSAKQSKLTMNSVEREDVSDPVRKPHFDAMQQTQRPTLAHYI